MEKVKEVGRVILNRKVAPGIWWMSIDAPQISRSARPGQFVHLRVVRSPIQFLRMPFAVYDIAPQMGSIDICYQVLGEGTTQLSQLVPNDLVDVIGPIGNGWSMPASAKNVLLVSGGVGAAPLNMLARAYSVNGSKVDIVMGAQSADMLVCRDRLSGSAMCSGGKLYITTDDGSEGTHGFATAVSDDLIRNNDYDYICVCGPGPMERNVVKPALEKGAFCEVSMERLMACGVGACLSCIVETTQGRKRCCVDGPVFNAAEVIW